MQGKYCKLMNYESVEVFKSCLPPMAAFVEIIEYCPERPYFFDADGKERKNQEWEDEIVHKVEAFELDLAIARIERVIKPNRELGFSSKVEDSKGKIWHVRMMDTSNVNITLLKERLAHTQRGKELLLSTTVMNSGYGLHLYAPAVSFDEWLKFVGGLTASHSALMDIKWVGSCMIRGFGVLRFTNHTNAKKKITKSSWDSKARAVLPTDVQQAPARPVIVDSTNPNVRPWLRVSRY